MAIAGSCVPTMEMPYFSITTSSECATLVYTCNIRKGHPGCLATRASHRYGPRNGLRVIIKHGQHHWSTWAEQSRM